MVMLRVRVLWDKFGLFQARKLELLIVLMMYADFSGTYLSMYKYLGTVPT